ncbi:MAG: hypothetical protein Q9162_003771 [Coniocarpon cinnabarinum]
MSNQRLQAVIFDIKVCVRHTHWHLTFLLTFSQFTQKQTLKRANKAEADRKKAEAEVKKELEKGRPEIARIAAAKAVRKERQFKSLKGLESRLDFIVDQLKDAATTKQIAADMRRVTINLGKIAGKDTDAVMVNDIMENFDAQTENVDLTSKGLEDMMNKASASTTDAEAEDRLMGRVQDQLGLEVSQEMPDTTPATKAKSMTIDEQKEADLEERLRRVRA